MLRSPEATTPRIAELCEALRAALIGYYGADYSFTIIGRGRLLAASDTTHGEVQAYTPPVVAQTICRYCRRTIVRALALWRDAETGTTRCPATVAFGPSRPHRPEADAVPDRSDRKTASAGRDE